MLMSTRCGMPLARLMVPGGDVKAAILPVRKVAALSGEPPTRRMATFLLGASPKAWRRTLFPVAGIFLLDARPLFPLFWGSSGFCVKQGSEFAPPRHVPRQAPARGGAGAHRRGGGPPR